MLGHCEKRSDEAILRDWVRNWIGIARPCRYCNDTYTTVWSTINMATEIECPTLGESVTSATVARWIKHQGETVAADEPLVELETDKVTVEVNAPAAGVLTSIALPEGSEVRVGAVLGMLDGAGAAARSRLLCRLRSLHESGVGARAASRRQCPRPASTHRPGRGPVARPATPPADVAAHAPLPAAAKMIAEQQSTAERSGPAPARTAASPRATCSRS